MSKQGGRLLGPENGEAIWLDDPSPECMVWCSGPLSWAPGTVGREDLEVRQAKVFGVLIRPWQK